MCVRARARVCVCVCVRERERERESVCVCVYDTHCNFFGHPIVEGINQEVTYLGNEGGKPWKPTVDEIRK